MKKQLPDKITLTNVNSGFVMSDELADKFCEEVNGYLADKYGFCVEGWSYQIDLSDIMWDTGE